MGNLELAACTGSRRKEVAAVESTCRQEREPSLDEEKAECTKLAALLRKHEWLSRCWLTNFCSDGYWESFAPEWRSALLSLTDEELQELPAALPVPAEWPEDLRELVLMARSIAPPDEATLNAGVPKVSPWLLDGVPHARNMGPKKQHEVLRLAPVVARVARQCGARTVVDLGSGHGYLSHVLAFHHGLHVVGLECAEHNVAAAHHRAWMVREKLRDPRFRVGNPRSADRCKRGVAAHAASAASGGGEAAAAAAARAASVAAAATSTVDAAAEAVARGAPSPLIAHAGGSFSNLHVRLEPDASVDWLARTLSPAIEQIGAHLESVDGQVDGASHRRFLLVGLHTCGDLAPTLLRLAATSAVMPPRESSEGAGVAEAGSTGDDGGDVRCVGVVSVGCCYHRISEPLAGEERPQLGVDSGDRISEPLAGEQRPQLGVDSGDRISEPLAGEERPQLGVDSGGAAGNGVAAEALVGVAEGEVAGEATEPAMSNFPMSAHCRRLGVQLGEISLHLSLQAVWRWPARFTSVADTVGKTRHHLYRCVLECRLQELRAPGVVASGMKLPRDGNVGPLPQCSTFAQYAQLAYGRLGLTYDADEAARLDGLWSAHAHLERPLRCFLMLRGVLSRPIERVILLDRLLFMREAGMPGTSIREIFDPATSPRSMALIAALLPATADPAADAACTACDADELG